MKSQVRLFVAIAAALVIAFSASGGVYEHTNKNQWQQSLSSFATITFQEVPLNTILTNQYQALGITFTDGNDLTNFNASFVNDFHGLRGNTGGGPGNISLGFSSLQYAIAVDHPGVVQFELFRDGESVYTSSIFGMPGNGFFAGIFLDEGFDAAIISRPGANFALIDDLHFGVPGPGAAPLLALAALWPRGRRRRS